MKCSRSGMDPKSAQACAASVAAAAPPVLAPTTGPTSTAAKSKTSPAGAGVGAAIMSSGPIAAWGWELAERPTSVAAGSEAPPEGAMSNGVYALPTAAKG
ncbi:hypothetical protein U0070_000113 [Myodes glareolus]|uniref:Uncharacterized protein n=1 Tax=Myodes glareolus TaxID=447135 RepID=A0AAW0I0A4_MYOGA